MLGRWQLCENSGVIVELKRSIMPGTQDRRRLVGIRFTSIGRARYVA
jgi:hypothetical protein